MAISADSGAMPALVSASFTFSRASGAVILQIVSASFEHDVHHFVFAGRFLGNHNFALAVEHPAYGARFGHVSAVLAHEMAKFADDTVAVRCDGFDEHADATGTVSFEGDFFILFAFELAGAAQDGALDVFV